MTGPITHRDTGGLLRSGDAPVVWFGHVGWRWPLLDELIASRAFADLDALETVLMQRCHTLRADRRGEYPEQHRQRERVEHGLLRCQRYWRPVTDRE